MFGQRSIKIFVTAKSSAPPDCTCHNVQSKIHGLLNPPWYGVVPRVLIIHTLGTFLTLLICPQLGVKIIPGFDGLYALFMRGGESFCMAMCGLTIMGINVFLFLKFLAPEFNNHFKKYVFAYLANLTGLTILILGFLGGKIHWETQAPFWSLGAVLGGWICFKLFTWVNREPVLTS